MPRLIKGNVIVDNEWQLIPADLSGDLPQGKLLVPLAKWLELKDAPVEGQTLAPWIDSEEEVEPVAAELLSAPLIAVHFPTFMDGRGFSTARLLRERFGYQGELRAVGYVIQTSCFSSSAADSMPLTCARVQIWKQPWLRSTTLP